MFDEAEYRDVHAYFASHPELAPTALKRLGRAASALGIHSVDAKDESGRFGVEAFKIVGVRYAVHRLGDTAASKGLVCATAGNHGRAVARVAHQKRIPCRVFVPLSTTGDPVEHATRRARVEAMRTDGATVVDVQGSYEEAVRQASGFAAASGATVVSDTSWPGYEQIPRWIMCGYTQLFEEAFNQWDAPPSLVVVQAGVGGLVCAAASWFAWRFGRDRPFFAAAEPDSAACLFASAEAGRPVTLTAAPDTIMAGLRCAEPSISAWPAVMAGVDAFVTVPDAAVREAMQALADGDDDQRIEAGPSGACGFAALTWIARAPEMAELRAAAGLDRSARALVIVTEGR